MRFQVKETITAGPAIETAAEALAIGRELARRVFHERGNHTEAHLTELELAGLLAWAAGRGAQIPTRGGR